MHKLAVSKKLLCLLLIKMNVLVCFRKVILKELFLVGRDTGIYQKKYYSPDPIYKKNLTFFIH